MKIKKDKLINDMFVYIWFDHKRNMSKKETLNDIKYIVETSEK